MIVLNSKNVRELRDRFCIIGFSNSDEDKNFLEDLLGSDVNNVAHAIKELLAHVSKNISERDFKLLSQHTYHLIDIMVLNFPEVLEIEYEYGKTVLDLIKEHENLIDCKILTQDYSSENEDQTNNDLPFRFDEVSQGLNYYGAEDISNIKDFEVSDEWTEYVEYYLKLIFGKCDLSEM